LADGARIPQGLKAAARPFVWGMSDALAKRRGDLLPPRRLVSQVPGDFKSVGPEFLGYFVELGALAPDQRLLDIGCGPGRMAIPLTGYLNEQGHYDGVDTWPDAVDWCATNITPRFSNFDFHTIAASEVVFPFEDGAFDFTILCALSRLDDETFAAYTRDAARVLRPGGVHMGTCFLASEAGSAVSERPRAIAFSEHEIRDLYASAALNVESIHRGRWDGHPSPLSYQDIVVARRLPL
jgi:SAM-dependent methyltransferase